MSDYSRSDFRERIARLGGSTTYREPIGGRCTDPSRPTDQDVAAALAMARRKLVMYGREIPDPQDIGPDVALAIYTGVRYRKPDVIEQLARAVANALPKRQRERLKRHRLRHAANAAYEKVVFDRPCDKHPDISEAEWTVLVSVCESVLINESESAIVRAEARYRRAA